MTTTINSTDPFYDIRPLLDSEVPETIHRLVANEDFLQAASHIAQSIPHEQFKDLMTACKSKNDFQASIAYPLLKQLIDKTTDGITSTGWDNIEKDSSYVFISNHRDIVLDAAFFNILLFEKNIQTTEIAIGDNLLIYPWIADLVRLNKSFIVKRGVSVRQMLEVSKHLSSYINHTITQRNQSIWIAQREGRAKDSDDKTQISLLKMLTLHDSANPLQALKQLRIVPLSISYEYDPCDYLKAKEYQLKRDQPDYKKNGADDIENMVTGITGYKKRVTFNVGECININMDSISTKAGRNAILEETASIIDNEIYKNYTFFPINYIAYDMMNNTNRFANKYTQEDIEHFNKYLQQRVDMIDIPNKDIRFLRDKIIDMYGNTVKNHITNA